MSESLEAEYRRRQAANAGEFDSAGSRAQTLLLTLLGSLALGVAVGAKVIFGSLQWWWLLLPVALAAVFQWGWQHSRSRWQRASRLLEFYQRGLGRIDGTAVQSGHTGEAFRQPVHLYDRDLDILGPNSVFGMLATTRTAVGQRALAEMLLHSADADTVRQRQAAVRELSPMLDLRESVALLGQTSFQEIPAESFDIWLSTPPAGLTVWMRWTLVATTVAWIAFVTAAAMHLIDMNLFPRNLAGLLALQGAFALWLRPRVSAELDAAQRLPGQTVVLRDGLELLRAQSFESPLLLRLQAATEGSADSLRSLAASLTLVDQRAKEWFYVPALALAIGSQATISLELWKRSHAAEMRQWLLTWAEFEALLALAAYAAEHAANIYPEIVANARFEADGLTHPLLQSGVANDVALGDQTRFLLISGSNMAGKSTLLRSIGCNAVLAQTGAPVCAERMTLSPLRVGASLALVDSLAEGKSKFLAEVERLRDLVALSAVSSAGGCLFLVDEIFSGTNSVDRRIAAEAVLRRLVEQGAIGALSTHDLALAELAEIPALAGRNVHMASPVEDDPLAFDYLLKPGVNRSTNALAIVRMLGL